MKHLSRAAVAKRLGYSPTAVRMARTSAAGLCERCETRAMEGRRHCWFHVAQIDVARRKRTGHKLCNLGAAADHHSGIRIVIGRRMVVWLNDRLAASPDTPQDSKADDAPQKERDDLNVGLSPRRHRFDPLVPFLAVMIDEVAHEKPEKEKPEFDDPTQQNQHDSRANRFNEYLQRAELICETY